MTDIEKLKKMNQMIPELKKHGFATDNSDAAKQSAEIYQNRYVEETKAQIASDSDTTGSTTGPVSQGGVTFDHLNRIKTFVNGRLNDMEASISTVTAKMNEMIKMINKLEKMQGSTAVKDDPETRQTVIKKEEKPTNPRSGNYNSNDVQIDKIFYFGNK